MKKLVSLLMIFVLVAMQFPATPVNAESSSIAWDESIASAYNGGSGSPEDPYLIANGAQLARMAQEVNNGNEVNRNYQLTENIDLAAQSWAPIGNKDFPFSGNFNGNGHSISNMKVGYIPNESRSARSETNSLDDTSRSQGVEVLYDPVTEALEQEAAAIKAELESVIAEEAAAQEETAASEETQAVEETDPAEAAEAPEENTSSDSVVTEDSTAIRAAMKETVNSVESNVTKPREAPGNFSLFSTQDPGYEGDAGLFGYFDSGKIEKVTVKESEVTGRGYTGGIVGYSGVNAVIEQCYFDGVVNNSTVGYIGGIVGYAEGRVSNCTNIGTIGSETPDSAFIGGIAGLTKNNIASCKNSGNILGNQSFLGGIAGKIDGKLIMDSFNIGKIGSADTVNSNAGGIVGRAPNGTLTRCANHGSVTLNPTDENSFISGLAGDIYIITNSYNSGDVSGYWASGLGGVINGGSLKNYNAGQITGGRNAGITCLLESMGTVGRNSTYCRNNSCSVAIRADAAYPYGGTPVLVSKDYMQDPDFIGIIGSPFIYDDYQRNNFYPVIEGVEYFITAPQGPGDFQTGTFNYAGARDKDSPDIKKDYPQTYHYSDVYFEQKASLYNPSLATMSMCMVMSGFNSNADASTSITDDNSKYSEKYKNAEKLLTDIGFTEIEANADYKIKPTENSFGVITGHKEITINGKKKTLIAQIGRGGNYGVEWSGNFMVGAAGEHQGFAEARDKAHGWLTNYINAHRSDPSFHEEDVVFWLSGYSRAAAVTNLLAGKMSTDLSIAGINYSNEDLYAYCLAPPMGALANESEAENRSYTNIHNVVNPNDFVPKVAPSAWDFTRYGVDEKVIPDRLTTSNGAIFTEMYGKLDGLETDWGKELLGKKPNSYVLNDFQGKKLSIGTAENPDTGENYLIKNSDIAMSKFLDQLMDLVADSIGNRGIYVQKYQATVSDLGGRALGDPEERELWQTTIPACLNTVLEENIQEVINILLNTPDTSTTDKINQAVDLLLDSSLDALEKEGINISREVLSDTFGLILRAGFDSLLTSGGSDIMTFFANMNLLAKPHYPELYFAWLQLHDPNYDGTPETYINTYRIASISGDADVSVYDAGGALVAQITDNEPAEIADSTIVASVDAGTEKSIYLPADATYDVKVDAKGEGTVNYAVREYNGDTASYAKMVNYYDIPVASGDRLEGIVPEFSNEDVANTKDGSSVPYALEKAESILTPSLEVTGDAAREALYNVTGTSNMEDKGLAFGTGTYCEGSTVQMVALPFEGKRFIGWYQGNEPISTDARYEFTVTKEVSFTAVFE